VRWGSLLGICVTLALGSAAAAATAKTTLHGIRTPSGNIKCLVIPGKPNLLHCTLGKASYASRLQSQCMTPSGSGVDWHGFELTATGKGVISCSGGILYSPETYEPSYSALVYGHSWRHGGFSCLSLRTGLSCRNSSGHGLFLSRASFHAW
jgi:hypothetical protein